ncbi:hypothetical protein ACJMK2_043576 [Sinanodonta woodiana]|uniref:Expansin-like EG45 domain-containing protein n=1 Tax=Sinanodonta woodiana TaxID=1069815 RepID=A0ABD3VXE6_SINWO
MFNLIFASLITASFAAYETEILQMYTHVFRGNASFYGTGYSGMCQIPPNSLPHAAQSRNTEPAALNKPQLYGSLTCGMCLRVTPQRTLVGHTPLRNEYVYITDVCENCLAGDIDLATNGDGLWAIDLQAAQCPVQNTKISYKFQGSQEWFIKLQIRNTRFPVTEVQMYQPQSRQWLPLSRSLDGFWEIPDSGHGYEKPIQTPFTISLRSPDNQVIYDKIPSIQNDVVFEGDGVQFAYNSALLQVPFVV